MRRLPRSCRLPSSFVALATAASLVSCSSSDKSGSPPTIKDFVLTPTTLVVGKTVGLDGSVTVEDPDGDIVGISGDIHFPSGTVVPTQDLTVAVGDAKSAPLKYTIPNLPVPQPGAYVVSIQARDREGHLSAKASVTLTAQ